MQNVLRRVGGDASGSRLGAERAWLGLEEAERRLQNRIEKPGVRARQGESGTRKGKPRKGHLSWQRAV